MIDSVGLAPSPPLAMDRMVWMRTTVSATYHPTVEVGDWVAEDQPVGELRDIFGDTIHKLHATAGGVVVFLVTSLAVKSGDPLLGIGVPASP
jgi:predicted deacylase